MSITQAFRRFLQFLVEVRLIFMIWPYTNFKVAKPFVFYGSGHEKICSCCMSTTKMQTRP